MELFGKKITAGEIAAGVVILILLAGLYYVGLKFFEKENKKEPLVNIDNDEQNPDHVRILMQIVSVDAVKGDMTIRMNPEPEGDLTKDSITLANDITIYTNSSSGKNEFNFPKGKKMNPFEIVIDMYGGAVMEYPYDNHNASLNLYVTSLEKDSSGKQIIVPVPMVKETNFFSSIGGFRVEEAKEVDQSSGYSEMEFHIIRTSSVTFFSTFIMVLMWLITISVILVLASIVIRKRKVEYSMFAFLSAMLFALPALRNVQPFTPALGTLSDYIAFFWAEAITAAGLILMILTWLKRPGVKQ